MALSEPLQAPKAKTDEGHFARHTIRFPTSKEPDILCQKISKMDTTILVLLRNTIRTPMVQQL
ncbi:MAG: hypothetical protein PWQ17_881 [Anaerophaga sp.]|jgi:hypothetical protein|nr:hypothetical protein [Anaerophaga sp.]